MKAAAGKATIDLLANDNGTGATEDMTEEEKGSEDFDMENDPDKPSDSVQSSVVVETIEMNGKKQKIIKKMYVLVDGTTKTVTKV